MIRTFRRAEGQLPYLTDDREGLGVKIAFTTRRGGMSQVPYDTLNLSTMVGDSPDAVEQNRRSVESAAGFLPDSLTLLKQVHGRSIAEAPAGSCGVIGEGDGLVAGPGGPTVGVLSADCVPVLLAGGSHVAAVHAGWRGLVAGIIEAAVERIGDVEHAWVGPSIHACCYEVGAEVVEAFEAAALPITDVRHVDPGRAALAILRRFGVDDITFSDDCTSCDSDFFSHRRDGQTGRQGGFIAWR